MQPQSVGHNWVSNAFTVLSVTERRVLKSPTITVDLTISPFIYFTVYFIYFKGMLLGAHPFQVWSSYKPCLTDKSASIPVGFCLLSFLWCLRGIPLFAPACSASSVHLRLVACFRPAFSRTHGTSRSRSSCLLAAGASVPPSLAVGSAVAWRLRATRVCLQLSSISIIPVSPFWVVSRILGDSSSGFHLMLTRCMRVSQDLTSSSYFRLLQAARAVPAASWLPCHLTCPSCARYMPQAWSLFSLFSKSAFV